MVETKYNNEMMALNQKQLEADVSRAEIRRQRRQVLEAILDRRDSGSRKRASLRSRRMTMFLISVAVMSVIAASYLLYLLSFD